MSTHPIFSASPSRPCWTCHWFGYFMAENNHSMCVNPGLSPLTAIPRDGCAFWRKGGPVNMERLEPGSQEREAVHRERDRLERILELGRRAEARLPHAVYVEVADRGGLLTLTIPPHNHYRGGTVEELMPILERTGVNNAVRAGRL